MTLPKFENVLAPSPFAVKIPKKAKKAKRAGVKRAVVYGDRHGVCADPKAEQILFSVIEDVQPDLIVNVGDDVDCYSISTFDRDPNRIHTLQDEIDNTRAHLHKVAQLAPDADKYWLEGNHEDRLRKLIWRLPGSAAQLAKLKVIKESLTWPVLASCAEIGWEFVGRTEQAKKTIIPQLILKHGTVVANFSGLSAKAEMDKYGKSGMSGHTHRLGAVYHRDYNGTHVWYETGCLCSLEPDYAIDPDWQQGLVVVDYTNDWFDAHIVFIQDGKARLLGQDYRA